MARDDREPSARAALAERGSPSYGLRRERLNEIQRTRMLVAMAEVACERGAGEVSVAHVVSRAGVSRRTFYELFEDREDCFLAAFEEAVARAGDCVSAGYDPRAPWAERIRGALGALLLFLEDEPALGRMAVVESLAGGAKALEMRQEVLVRMAAAVDGGRERTVNGASATALTAEGVVGGVVSVIHGRLVTGDPKRLVDLLNQLMSMVVLPYLGPAASRRELERAPAKVPLRGRTAPASPLRRLDMRLTYRTVRVLSAVAANPGRSNRAIGDAAGVGDPGQISKLLTRLERLGLVENAYTGLPKGARNAWTLTERGKEVDGVLGTRVTPS
jgi:AcrR family transcriptional regulator